MYHRRAMAAGTDDEQAAAAASDHYWKLKFPTDDNAWRPAEAVDVDPRLLMAARCGNSELLKNLLLQLNKDDDVEAGLASVLPRVTMEGDTLLHVVAACGGGGGDDAQKFIDCVNVIFSDVEKKKGRGGAAAGSAKRLALKTGNNNGDTPLHCAAAAGNDTMITYLVDLMANNDKDAAELKKGFVRLQNECGETALHHAVRAPKNNEACINKLLEHDAELALVLHKNGTSPLYLAITSSLGQVEIAEHLFNKTEEGKLLSYSGPDGRNVLHAAVSCEKALPMILEWLKNKERGTTADNDMGQQEGQGEEVGVVAHRLLTQLTNQRDKENGSTPLHLAAALRWLGSPARLLLEANESTAYQPDKRGMYPIHVAAGSGCLGVVKTLLERCPGCATLRDAKGRTFLHVAVEEMCLNVVRHVCLQSQGLRQISAFLWFFTLRVSFPNAHRRRSSAAAGASLLSSILNAQDINGDTPLHRAVHGGKWPIFFCLVENHLVRLNVTNKDGMTPIDVAWSKMPSKVYYAWEPRMHIRRYLLKVGATYGEKSRGNLFHQKYVLPKQEEDKVSANMTASAQVLCIFSVLITTVTFASAFTLPGGYQSAGDGGGVAGTPVLAGRSYAFDAFVLSDALAFICSLYATSLLLYAGVPYGTLTHRFALMNLAYTLMWHAGRCLLAAFALGLYVMLLPVARTIAIAVAVLIVIIVRRFIKPSEGIESVVLIGRNQRKPSARGIVFAWIVYFVDRFWSYILIFGIPAIRKWARLP